MTATLIAGLLAGIVFGVGLGQMDDTVHSIDELRGVTSVPILGGVTAIHPKSWRRQRALDSLLLSFGVLALLGVYLGWLLTKGLLHLAP